MILGRNKNHIFAIKKALCCLNLFIRLAFVHVDVDLRFISSHPEKTKTVIYFISIKSLRGKYHLRYLIFNECDVHTGCAEKRIQPMRGRTTRNLGEEKIFFTAFVLPPLQETEISLHMMVQFMELKNLLWRMRKLMYFEAHERDFQHKACELFANNLDRDSPHPNLRSSSSVSGRKRHQKSFS